MAFERLVSICFPLQSSTIITNRYIFGIIVFSWVLAFAILVAALVLITHLSFCKPVLTVMSYFCDHGPVFQIACGSILMSYVFIITAVSQIKSVDGQWKTFKTCSVHLILVAIFFIPILVTYTIALIYTKIDAVLTPLLSPIIYTLKTEEVLEQIRKFLRKHLVKPLW
ncbi:hypothetical protein Z043_126235 [Scleropages formosus]|uniref:G-protein coupled receptors family 1 profile domain-containing protein n=1 Tax=Scleropages formosus TaxID=113540 RepID=A0A0P7TRV1_SCLFO|nr:hypothetical protein Z043_126235 [Scleropages formosus]